MRVLVCGGRDFSDIELFEKTMEQYSEVTTIIHGSARGADMMAHLYGLRLGVEVLEFPADWDTYGKAAGPIRNKQMLTEGKPDLVVAFPGGKGTTNMCKQAIENGVKTVMIEYAKDVKVGY